MKLVRESILKAKDPKDIANKIDELFKNRDIQNGLNHLFDVVIKDQAEVLKNMRLDYSSVSSTLLTKAIQNNSIRVFKYLMDNFDYDLDNLRGYSTIATLNKSDEEIINRIRKEIEKAKFMKDKLVKESILKGPSDEEIKAKIDNIKPNEALRQSLRYNYYEGVIDAINKVEKLDISGHLWHQFFKKISDDKIPEMIEVLEKNNLYRELAILAIYKNLEDILKKYINKLPKEMILYHSWDTENYNLFLLALEHGANINILNINYNEFSKTLLADIIRALEKSKKYHDLFKIGYITKNQRLIKKYRDNFLPKEFKNIPINELSKYLTVKDENIKYPQGFMKYKLLKFLYENSPLKKKKQISEFMYKLNHGEENYDPKKHGSYYMRFFQNNPQFITKDDNKNYIITVEGYNELKRLEDKLKKKYPKLIQ